MLIFSTSEITLIFPHLRMSFLILTGLLHPRRPEPPARRHGVRRGALAGSGQRGDGQAKWGDDVNGAEIEITPATQ